MIKKQRSYIFMGAIYFALGLIGLLIKEDLIHYLNVIPIYIITISLSFLLMGLGLILYVYLQGGFSKEGFEKLDISRDYIRQFERLRNEIAHKLESEQKVPFDEKKIEAQINSRIDKITSDTLLEQIKSRYEDKLIEDLKYKSLEEELSNIKIRIDRENARVTRNGNINLTIGFFTTFMAIFFLGYSLLGVSHTTENTQSFIFHFIPRFTLSLFIELFSFFFLRIYKKNLDDIKYLNNERTNIDLKLIALKTSIIHNDNDSLKIVLNDLSKTERNFILQKDESTVDLEKNKIEKLSTDKLLESIVQIVNKK